MASPPSISDCGIARGSRTWITNCPIEKGESRSMISSISASRSTRFTSASRSMSRGLTNLIKHLPNELHHELRFIDVDTVPAFFGDDVPALREGFRQLF